MSGPDKVRAALEAAGVRARVMSLPSSTRTAQEAADAIGCTVSEIAKSLVFQGKTSGSAILAVVSGSNRVDTVRLAAVAGETVDRASPDFVKSATGYAIGGVPPVAHATEISIFFDEDLLGFETIWAAAGGPRDVFEIDPKTLTKICAATVAPIKE